MIGCTGFGTASAGIDGLHLLPDRVRDRDAVAVQIHAEGRDHVGLRADADGRADRLSREHVRAVELAADHAIEQDLPVRLGFEGHEESFVLEEPELLRDHERRAVGQLDEAELELVLLELEGRGRSSGSRNVAKRIDRQEREDPPLNRVSSAFRSRSSITEA